MDPNLRIRLERARSWFSMAEALSNPSTCLTKTENTKDEIVTTQVREHERFIFYWIAFNCLYGRRYYDGSKVDQETDIQKFLKKVKLIGQFDRENNGAILAHSISRCRAFGRKLVLDRFLDDRYWQKRKKISELVHDSEEKWREVERELDTRKDSRLFLELVFDRLRVLRNQIMHGCASYGPQSKGYKSLLFGVRFLEIMMPAFLMLAEKYGESVTWEKAPYPRKGHIEHPW